MYTPRVGENSKYDSPLLSPRDRPAPLCLLSSTEGNEFNAAFNKKKKEKKKLGRSNRLCHSLELKYVGGNLNIERKRERTEGGLRGPRLLSLCVVLMSTFVQTVAFLNPC